MSPPKSDIASEVRINADDEIDLALVLRALLANKRFIFLLATGATVVSLSLSFILPKKFIAEAVILPTAVADPAAGLAAGIAGQLGSAAALLGGLGGDRSGDLLEVLRSRTLVDRVIDRCNLDKEIKDWDYRSDLVLLVRKMTNIAAPSMKIKSIKITVEYRDPDMAALIANSYVHELKESLDRMGYNTASKNRRFIESNLAKAKIDLARAEDSLADFQSKSQLVSLPEAVMAAIKSVSELEAERLRAEVELKSVNELLRASRESVSSLQSNPQMALESALKQRSIAAQESALSAAKNRYQRQLVSLPPKAIKLARLQRDLQVQNALYLVLVQQLATAQLSEGRESDAFLVIDKAVPPDKHSSPDSVIFGGVGLFLGLAAGVMLSLFGKELKT